MDAGEYFPSLEDMRAEVGLDVDDMRAGLRALTDAWPPYLAVTYTMAGPAIVGGHVDSVSERARRELGTWPSAETVLDQLIAALQAEEAQEGDPERRSRLRAAAAVLGDTARQVAVAALAAKLGTLG